MEYFNMSADKAVGDKVGPDHDQAVESLRLELELHDSTKPNSVLCPSIEYALAFSTRAVVADYRRKYKEALGFYQESVKCFLYALENDAKLDDTKNIIRKKMKQYEDRAAVLKSFLDKRTRLEKLKELAAV